MNLVTVLRVKGKIAQNIEWLLWPSNLVNVIYISVFCAGLGYEHTVSVWSRSIQLFLRYWRQTVPLTSIVNFHFLRCDHDLWMYGRKTLQASQLALYATFFCNMSLYLNNGYRGYAWYKKFLTLFWKCESIVTLCLSVLQSKHSHFNSHQNQNPASQFHTNRWQISKFH